MPLFISPPISSQYTSPELELCTFYCTPSAACSAADSDICEILCSDDICRECCRVLGEFVAWETPCINEIAIEVEEVHPGNTLDVR